MRVITPKEMAATESLAYQDGFSEEAFMEQAGKGIADCIDADQVLLLCGKGNNTGDAYVAGFYLLEKGCHVEAIQITDIKESSPLCQKNYKRFIDNGGKLRDTFPTSGVILDGLFGTGFHGTLQEPFASIVSHANASPLPIISIDIPSGLNGETGEIEGQAIIAQETIFLGLPKTGFFLNEGWNHVGSLSCVNFGLEKKYCDQARENFHLLTKETVEKLLPKIKRNRHKYQAGHVVGLAGSPNMPGAALLASEAALHGGAGILHLLHPKGMESELSNSPYEVIKIPYNNPVEELNTGKAAFIGPGIGRSDATRALLKQVLSQIKVPCVIDADALTLIAEGNLPFPKNAIFTPHHGEMARLFKQKRLSPDFLNLCHEYATKHHITLVLKGAPTFIFHPEKLPIVNPTGCPGMATAGSGDVLTGLIAALLAQGLTPYDAAKVGVYLHGLAGEIAEEEMTPYCMVASDITLHFSEAFKVVSQKGWYPFV